MPRRQNNRMQQEIIKETIELMRMRKNVGSIADSMLGLFKYTFIVAGILLPLAVFAEMGMFGLTVFIIMITVGMAVGLLPSLRDIENTKEKLRMMIDAS